MKKLRLSIGELRVDSFETMRREERPGTVRGFDSTTGFQVICGCTDNGEACDTDDCSNGCSNGCTNTCPNTNDPTCATGFQVICECG